VLPTAPLGGSALNGWSVEAPARTKFEAFPYVIQTATIAQHNGLYVTL